jgi:Histidine kinase-, DNA gyrase B-, and HSP90-like ATPase
MSPPAGNDTRSDLGSAGDPGLHGKLDAMFVNLSHRSQTLVERQIRLLQILEQGEKDPERQAILFRLDRIASRMHRNSENLLILAGQEPSNNWNQPVALANAVRVAVSEVEESQRVSLNAHPDVAIVGSAVNDVVHLLAELIENATSFSAADMRVDISARLLTSGGALIDITDQGIGMTPKEMAYANWRLENPPTTEMTVPKWIGLFVVARLAARHGIGIRLQPAEVGGLTALVWLPNEVLTQPGTPPAPRFSDFGTAATRRGLHEAEPEPGYASVGRRPATARFAPPAGNGGKPQLDRRPAADQRQRSDTPWSPGAQSALWAGPAADAASPGPESHDAMGEHAGVSGQPARNSGGEPAGNIAGGNVSVPLGSTGSDTSRVATSPGHTTPASQESSLSDGVIVPSAEGLAEKRALPIFNEVESLWFRDGRGTPASSGATATTGSRWSSPMDAGWHAAEAADAPSSDGSTAAGLPKRSPRANLIPGAVSSTETALPNRSAAAARERLAGLQRGNGEGRAAATQEGRAADTHEDRATDTQAVSPGEEEESSLGAAD